MHVAIVCTALLGLLLFGLGLAVSMTRGRTGIVAGSSNDPADSLYLLVGAHNPATWLLWTMIVAVVSRYLIAIGMIAGPTLAKPQPLRFVGALGTYLTGILLCIGAFMTPA